MNSVNLFHKVHNSSFTENFYGLERLCSKENTSKIQIRHSWLGKYHSILTRPKISVRRSGSSAVPPAKAGEGLHQTERGRGGQQHREVPETVCPSLPSPSSPAGLTGYL